MHVTLDHTELVADHITSFYFQPDRRVRYSAGQFIELTLPHDSPDERGIRHWFTLSSSPTEELLAITTKLPARGPTSTYKQTLFALQPGDQVHMSDPMGDFVLPKDTTRPLVFIAGGIGITPMRSMVKWLQDQQEQRTIQLLYAAKCLEEVAFRELFTEYGLPVTLILDETPPGWQGETGHLSGDRILNMAPDVDNKLYFISGPETMVEQLVKELCHAEVPDKRIVGDYFPNYKTN